MFYESGTMLDDNDKNLGNIGMFYFMKFNTINFSWELPEGVYDYFIYY